MSSGTAILGIDAPAPGPEPPDVPPGGAGTGWERRDEMGSLAGLARTVIGFLLWPRDEAARMRSGGGLADPLLFALIVITLSGTVLLGLLGVLLAHPMDIFAAPADGASGYARLAWGLILLVLAVQPLFVTLGLMAAAVVLHVAVIAVGANRAGFDGTFRALAYTLGAVSLLLLVPLVGPLLALGWAPITLTASVASAHRTSRRRALSAVLLPPVLFLLAFGAVCLFLVLILTWTG